MTKRERYMKALHNKPVDELVWAPNFDYWLSVSRAEKTVPAKYADMSGNDIIRAVDGTIWRRADGVKEIRDPSVVRSTEVFDDGGFRDTFTTPVGAVSQVCSTTEGEHRSKACTEHLVKSVDDLRVMQYIVEASHFEAHYGPTLTALGEVGDDGIVLTSFGCVPFLQFAKSQAGYVNGLYLWMDEREKVDRYIATLHRHYVQGYGILADGPADVIATGDNMDAAMISPDIFKEYALPFYTEVGELVHATGKKFEGHWCGRTDALLPMVPGSGLDIVEAIVSQPMSQITLREALEALDGQVVLQGGIPSVLVCEQGGSRDDFKRYIEDTVLPEKDRTGFVLGMSDNVPPDADFGRIEMVADLIRTRNPR